MRTIECLLQQLDERMRHSRTDDMAGRFSVLCTVRGKAAHVMFLCAGAI